MYIYYALINTLSTHIRHINLNTIFCTHAEDSPTKTTTTTTIIIIIIRIIIMIIIMYIYNALIDALNLHSIHANLNCYR